MAITIGEVRKKYPEYGDLSDQALADALHKKHYADMPKPDFYGKIGLSTGPKKPGMLDGAKTKPLAGSGGDDLGSKLLGLGDQMGRTFVGAAADTVDAAAGFVNKPLDAVLDMVGSDVRFDQGIRVGKSVPQPVGAIPQLVRGVAPYAAGATGASRAAAAASPKIAAAIAAKPIVSGAVAGAGVDAAMSNVQESNLSNLIAEMGGPTLPTARVPGEAPGIAAIKDMAEGGVIGGVAEGAIRFFSRGPAARPNTSEALAEEADIEAAIQDPVVRAQLEANGITPETSPRYQEFVSRIQTRQAAESAGRDPQSVIAEAVGVTSPPARAVTIESLDQPELGTFAPNTQGGWSRLEALRDAPNLPPTTREDISGALLGDIDPSRIRAPSPTPLPETIAVDPAGVARTGDLSIETGEALRRPSNLPVPLEPQTPRMSDADIAQAQRTMDAGNPNPIPPQDAVVAPEGRLPQTRDDIAGQRDAGQAFDLAARQEERVAPGIRDTQTAGLPEGPKPQAVTLDEGFPVRVVESGKGGAVKVERYDPRTGIREDGAEPYWTTQGSLHQTDYVPEPRMAQDFAARDNPARMSPEEPRTDAQPVSREPTQTYRATPEAPNDGGPPFPEQADGPMPGPTEPRRERAQRAANEEELRARYEQAKADKDFTSRARESYKDSDAKSSTVAQAPAADSRFETDELGLVRSDKGGPVKFGDQKQAAKWILNVGHKTSPDQIFEIANGPKGGFTVRETGRSENATGGTESPARGQEGPEGAPTGEVVAPPARPAAEAEGGVSPGPKPAPEGRSEPEGQTFNAPEAARSPVQAEPSRDLASGAPAKNQTSNVGSQGTPPTAKSDRAAKPPRVEPKRGADADGEDMTDEAADALYDKLFNKGKGTKLYSNPLDPDAIKELLTDPAAKLIKKEIDGFKASLDEVKADLKGLGDNASIGKALGATATAVRKVWWSNTAAIRAVAAKHKDVPEVQELADLVGTDPGRGRLVGQTYERAVQMRAMGMSNRLQNILQDKVKPEFEARIADILAGRKRAISGSREEEAARRIRKLLDEQHDYLTEAGLDVGYVKGRYYPRVIDEDAVLKDAAAFKEKAAEVYRKMDLSPKAAKGAAEEWYGRILGVSDGAYASGLPTSRHTAGRTLPADADRILEAFYSKDPRANLAGYFRQTSKAAEFARRFGKNGEKADDLFNAMLKKGVPGATVDSLRHHFESSVGLLYSTRPDKGAAAFSWLQTAGVLRLLPRAVISSAAESLATGIRAHDVGAGFKALKDSYAILFGLDDAVDVRQTAELLGIVGDAMNDLVLNAQFGGEVSGLVQQKLLSRFFRTTHLHQLTEAQRLAATRVGQGMIRTLLQDVSTGNKRQKSALRLLNELGMDEAAARSVTKWLDAKGAPPMAELTGNRPEAVAYRTALQRFTDESIMNPSAADKPQWAGHPFGRFAFAITSFTFSFTRNVLLRSVREAGEAVSGKGYTSEDRLRLIAPALGLAVLTAAQGQVSELRDEHFNPGSREERTDFQRMASNLSRAGAFGNADPFVNIALSARYNRDLTSLGTGAYLTADLDTLSKLTVGLIPKEWGGSNTESTNNAEWQAAKAGYDGILAPLMAAGLSLAPGGPVLRVGYGVGLVEATSPKAAKAAANAVAGERDVKPGGEKLKDDIDLSDEVLDDSSFMPYDTEEPGEE